MGTGRLYDNASRVFAAMYADAVPVAQLAGQDRYLAGMVPVGSLGVWLGALTRLCEGLGLPSTAQYHQVKGALVRMGAVAQLRRGTYHRIGAWALLSRPTEELWEARIGQLGRPSREAARRQRHQRDLDEFFAHGWRSSSELLALVQAAGVRDIDGLGKFLAALPVERQRELAIPCLGDHVLGAEHSCRWEPGEVHPTPALA